MNPLHNQGGVMKQLIAMMLVVFLATPVYAGVSKTQGEQKMSRFISQIHSNLESARESTIRVYNKAKTYLADHPSQFTGQDKSDISDLQINITNVQNAINDLLTEIETKFPGLVE